MPHDKHENLSVKSLNLLHADYTHAIERTLEANEHFEDFPYGIPREMLINEIKQMENWIAEYDLNGDASRPDQEA